MPLRRRHEFPDYEAFVVFSMEMIMTQLDDLKAAQAQTLTDVNALNQKVAAVGTQIANLTSQVAALQQQLADAQSSSGVDLTDAITSANAIDASLQAATAALTADLPAATNQAAPAPTPA